MRGLLWLVSMYARVACYSLSLAYRSLNLSIEKETEAISYSLSYSDVSARSKLHLKSSEPNIPWCVHSDHYAPGDQQH
jgi:hypothetical protein